MAPSPQDAQREFRFFNDLGTVTLSRPLCTKLCARGLIHGHFVAPFTATLSRFPPRIHGHFVAQSYS
jgi:hypothetical protein